MTCCHDGKAAAFPHYVAITMKPNLLAQYGTMNRPTPLSPAIMYAQDVFVP